MVTVLSMRWRLVKRDEAGILNRDQIFERVCNYVLEFEINFKVSGEPLKGLKHEIDLTDHF